jgi:predicted negative regulator of RcsB-dependent stress response
MFEELKLLIVGGLKVVIIGLSGYSWHLSKVNTKLTADLATAEEAGRQAQSAALECNNGVTKLQDAEKTKTDAAQVAVDEAKKDAQGNYTAAAEVLDRKPTLPKVTVDNVATLGGADAVERMKDYYATQDLFNEAIDRMGTGDAK